MRVVVALFAIILFSGQALSNQEAYDIFRLGNKCRPLTLLVENLDKYAADIGLERRDIETTIRSRMRGARIYSDNEEASNYAFLHARIDVFRPAFNIRLELNKVMFESPDSTGFATESWGTGTIGTHGGDANYVLSSVARLTDYFIDEYLRVNKEACEYSKATLDELIARSDARKQQLEEVIAREDERRGLTVMIEAVDAELERRGLMVKDAIDAERARRAALRGE